MSINDIIATNTMHAYDRGVAEGRKQLKAELEHKLEEELKDLELYGRTGLWGIHKALHLLRKETK